MPYYRNEDIIGWARNDYGGKFPIVVEGAVPITKEEYDKERQMKASAFEADVRQHVEISKVDYVTAATEVYKRTCEDLIGDSRLQTLDLQNPQTLKKFASEFFRKGEYSCHRYAGIVAAIFDRHIPPIPYRCWQGTFDLSASSGIKVSELEKQYYAITHVWIEQEGKIYEVFSDGRVKPEFVERHHKKQEIVF